jgi:putative endonuclease
MVRLPLHGGSRAILGILWDPGRAEHPGDNGERRQETVSYWMYILASKPRGTLYVGVTNDLVRRIAEHRDGIVPGFTKTYNVKMLVYFEEHESLLEAIKREKQVKRWARSWKIELIRAKNADWRDLFDEIV